MPTIATAARARRPSGAAASTSVMPAHSSGAATSSAMRVGDAQHVVLVDDDLRGVAAVRGRRRRTRGRCRCRPAVARRTAPRRPGSARTRGRSRRSSRRRRGRRRRPVTSAPTARDDAGDLVPGHHREERRPHSSRAWWMSEWQMPAYAMSMRTSCSRSSRRSMVPRSNAFGAGGDQGVDVCVMRVLLRWGVRGGARARTPARAPLCFVPGIPAGHTVSRFTAKIPRRPRTASPTKEGLQLPPRLHP